MIPEHYWKLEHTPMKNSPVGKVMQVLITQYPHLTPSQACELVHKVFARGARSYEKKIYAVLVKKDVIIAISQSQPPKKAIPRGVLDPK